MRPQNDEELRERKNTVSGRRNAGRGTPARPAFCHGTYNDNRVVGCYFCGAATASVLPSSRFMPDWLTLPQIAQHFATAVIGGAVGGVFGTGFKWIELRAERTRRRKALATALLNDLRGLELTVRQVREADYAAKVWGFPNSRPGELIKRITGSDDLHLFGPETVSRLLYLTALLTSLGELSTLYPKVTVGQDRATLNIRARAQCHFIANQVRPMKIALERQGGTPPPPESIDVIGGLNLPPLGPPAFAEWSVPDESLSGGRVWVNDAGRPRADDPPSPAE